MKRAILTGFEPFGPYKYNPTQDMARLLNYRRVGNLEISGLVLPCTYYGTFNLLSEKITQLSPELVISGGLSSSIRSPRLELIGRNIMNGKYPDAHGRKPYEEPLVPEGDLFHAVNTDIIWLEKCLSEKNIEADVSADAGEYICNALIYLTMKMIHEETLPVRFSFFHTPWTEDYRGKMDLEPNKVTIAKSDLEKFIEVLATSINKTYSGLPLYY
jgi:pyroglutamyl-peptidase